MSSMYFLLFAVVLFALELLYFRLARAYQIIDKPNERSLHENPTIRGGGIIFPIALLLFFITGGGVSYYFLTATLLMTIVGVADDIKGLSRFFRFGIQIIS